MFQEKSIGIDRLLITSDNRIWITTNMHYFLEFDKKTSSFRKINILNKDLIYNPSKTQNFTAYHLTQDHQGFIWITTAYGYLLRYDIKTEEIVTYVYTQNQKAGLMFIFEDADFNLWMGSWKQGIYKISKDRNEVIHFMPNIENPNTLTNHIIHSGFQDKAGYLWFGTEYAGLNILKKDKKFTILANRPNQKNTFPSAPLKSICVDDSNHIWVGTRGEGLYSFKKEKPDIVKSNNEILNINDWTGVYSLLYSTDGFIWIGTNQGLYKYHPKTKSTTHYKHHKSDYNSISNRHVFSLVEDADHNIWIGTLKGLTLLDVKTNTFKRFANDVSDPNSLSNDVVRSLYCDSHQTIWVGTQNGLNKFNKKTGNFTLFKDIPDTHNSINGNIINTIHEYNESLWIGTEGGGLNEYDLEKNTFNPIDKKEEFIFENVRGINSDNNHNLWISTTHNIVKFNTKTKIATTYGKSDGLQNQTMIINAGLQDLEFSYGFSHKDKQGYLYFGGIAGMCFFHPDNLPMNTFKPPVKIDQLLVNGKTHELTNQIILQPQENNLELQITTLNFIQPKKNKYAFFLENKDSVWQYTDNINKKEYFNLSSGNYLLHYKGANNDNIWSEQLKPIRITILPHFYQTRTFYFLIIVIILLIVLAFFLHKNFIKKKIARQKEKMRYSNSNLNSKEAKRINLLLENELLNTEIYLEADLTLHKLAKKIEVTPNKLSQVINQIHKRNFNEFINLYRLNEAKKLLIETTYKIEAVAFDSGFNSISTFNTIFKKETGETPSAFRKKNK